MHHSAFMGRLQRRGNLARNRHRLFHLHGPAEHVPFHQFHHQRALLYAVYGGDIGMIQRRQDRRLVLKSRHVLSIPGDRGR